jgi:hypothetical protein
MLYSMVSEDAFVELSILREKAAVALECIIHDDATCAHGQTLSYIASDYLSEMRETIQAMQKNMVTVPAA